MLEEKLKVEEEEEEEEEELPSSTDLRHPFQWLQALAKETHWSFIFGIVAVNGVSQGLGGAVCRVASEYFWKDLQQVRPSESQVYQGVASLPWIVKPLWGLLTDVVPVAGYRRKPYFLLAGFIGAASMLMVWLKKNLCAAAALLLLTAANAGSAIADVTIDACVAQKSVAHPSLAADLQSLCGLSSSIGGLLGFFISGFLIDAIDSKGVLGLLSLPALLVVSVAAVLKEEDGQDFSFRQLRQKVPEANQAVWRALKRGEVWKPCLFMFALLALSLNIKEGMFYWYTDGQAGPAFSKKNMSFSYSIGSVGSLFGVLLYQSALKSYPFHTLLLWTQVASSVTGMSELLLLRRLNLKLGVGDYALMLVTEAASHIIGRVRWMAILVLSSRLCPPGVEGTFFALLMSVDHAGMLAASWSGGALLQLLKVGRTEFGNLWAAVLVRNLLRLVPALLLNFLPWCRRSFVIRVQSGGDEERPVLR